LSRRLAAVPALGILAIALSAWLKAPQDRPSDAAGNARETYTIRVNLSCNDIPSDDWVSDSVVEAKRGDEIVWELTAESDAKDFKVRKKHFWNRWLFRRDNIPGGPGNPARGNDMKDDAEGTYRYEIIGQCQGPEKAFVDPEIIIDPT
jgi:hypothetical protein